MARRPDYLVSKDIEKLLKDLERPAYIYRMALSHLTPYAIEANSPKWVKAKKQTIQNAASEIEVILDEWAAKYIGV